MEILGLILIFGSILFLAFVTTKLVGAKTGKAMRGTYINVIETVGIGVDKQLHLLKVADQFILIASSGKNIQFLTSVKLDDFEPELLAESNVPFDFASIFEKYVQNIKGRNGKDSVVNEQADEQIGIKYSSAFNKNLNKLRNMNSNAEKYTGVNEDEGKNVN